MNDTFFLIPTTLPDENRLHDWLKLGTYPTHRKQDLHTCAMLIQTYYRGRRLEMPRIPKGARCRFRFDWHEPNRRRDPDNIAAGGRKIILDAMRLIGMLHNDGWASYVEGEVSILDCFHTEPGFAGCTACVQVFVQWFAPGEATSPLFYLPEGEVR